MSDTANFAIELPDGRTASYEVMQAYGEALQDFVRQQEATLASIESTQHYNQAVDFLQQLADGYNEQLRRYKMAESERERQFLLLIGMVGGR